MEIPLKDVVEIISLVLVISGVYWKLNERMKVIEVKYDQQSELIKNETKERKEFKKHFEDSLEKVEVALKENTSAITELKTVLDLIKNKIL
jgi:hypothetical protein